MIKEGMFARCPIGKYSKAADEHEKAEPRDFALGIVRSVDEFSRTADISFMDPFNYKVFYDSVPTKISNISLDDVERCTISNGSHVRYNHRSMTVVGCDNNGDGYYSYYLQDNETKEIVKVQEYEIDAPFTAGESDPIVQMKHYEFQNPCWYMGRQVVENTMNILENSNYGFKELAGCRMYLKAFQLDTIIRCLQTSPIRYMIADEVGLGKTIEACSILKIYLSSTYNQNVLIVVPSPLVAQWRTELFFKFDLFEGENGQGNLITLISAEELNSEYVNADWNFLIVDEVHNYLPQENIYDELHLMSKNAGNVLLLSATPIQQRQTEYLKLLKLVLPERYDAMTDERFSDIVSRQKKIARSINIILDDIDTFKNELIPDLIDSGEDLHENPDVIDAQEELVEELKATGIRLNDINVAQMIESIDLKSEDFGMTQIRRIVAYICENYQIERNIIRGRRKQNVEDFSRREKSINPYSLDDDGNYYEQVAYHALTEWIRKNQNDLDDQTVIDAVIPLMMSFFSSPWAYSEQLKKVSDTIEVPEDVIKSSERWLNSENEAIEDIADVMDTPQDHPSRLINILTYIDENLAGKKVVLFTDFEQTFEKYLSVFENVFGEELVSGFGSSIPLKQAEINIYKFQTDPECQILICDKSGGEGRNLQCADYIVHIDLPWDISELEQRIGRLDRMGRDTSIPVTSVVFYATGTYEEQLIKFWNEGLNVFEQSLSGLEIMMYDINNKIRNSIKTDFEFGLQRLIPELIKEADTTRKQVQNEQHYDSAAKQYRPLFDQLKRTLRRFQLNENSIFERTMMSWSNLAGFGVSSVSKQRDMVSFSSDKFSPHAAQNAFLIPPDWAEYTAKKQNEHQIEIQRGLEEKEEKTVHSNRVIRGTFNRSVAISSDYIHFFAPGDEVFDCIVNNAETSDRGKSCAFAAESNLEWGGFIYTYSISPNFKILIDNGISLYAIGTFRNYLASSMQIIPVSLSKYDVPEEEVIKEYRRIIQRGYFNGEDFIEHLGRRGRKFGFLGIPTRTGASNLDFFKMRYPKDAWENLIDASSKVAKRIATKRFVRESDLAGVRDMMEQMIYAREASNRFYGNEDSGNAKQIKHEMEIIYRSLKSPVIKLESICFMRLVKND